MRLDALAVWKVGVAAWLVTAASGAGSAWGQTQSGALPDLSPEAVEVVLGPGQKELDPIAIPEPVCKGPGEICATVAQVLRNDLKISGFFKVLPPKTYLGDANGEPLDKPKWPDWFNVGAKFLVKGQVVGAGGALSLEFRLYNVVDQKTIPTRVSSFKDVTKGTARAAVHEFANAVIEALTGQPGVFGTRIAYAAKTGPWTKGIFVMDMDGHNAGGVVSNERINTLPSFASGGIVYTSQGEGENPRLHLGGKRLSSSPGKYRKAVQGPDGSFAVSVDTGSGSDIWLMDAGGKLLKNLTKGRGDNVSPSWSPDGKFIAFVSNRSGGPQVFVMGADGGGQRRLTMAGAYNSTPDFGPNGLIAFAGLDGGHSDIFTVDLAGNIQRVTQDQGSNRDPTWSPDGRWLAFVSNRDGTRIWISTADGRYQFPISQRPCSCATPTWGD